MTQIFFGLCNINKLQQKYPNNCGSWVSCDPLEMESEDRSYTKHGKRYCATQFDNHLVNERCWASETLPIVKAILKILKEEVKEDVQPEFQPNHTRRRAAKTLESEQVPTGNYAEKGVTLHGAFESTHRIYLEGSVMRWLSEQESVSETPRNQPET